MISSMVEVLKTGLYSSIQDRGRFGYADKGVPVSGAMDLASAQLANRILGNPENAAVLEMTMTGATLKFHVNTFIAITGAEMTATLNDSMALDSGEAHKIQPGDVLQFGRVKQGYRTYLAVAGGFKIDEVLGSRSMYHPVTPQATINRGDLIFIEGMHHLDDHHSGTVNQLRVETSIEVFKGPEFHLLDSDAQHQLLNTDFTISKYNNRMAYQLEGALEHDLPSLLTSPVLPGTVQLTPSGKLIILMRDAQTTGGYPRVLQLTEPAIDTLSQTLAGNPINFRLNV